MPLDGDDLSIPAIVDRFLTEARARNVHLSVGATATRPDHPLTIDQLLLGADQAMYGAAGPAGRGDEPPA